MTFAEKMDGTRNYQSNPDSHKYDILIDRAYILIFICGDLGCKTRKTTMGTGTWALGWGEKEKEEVTEHMCHESREETLGGGVGEQGPGVGLGKPNKNKVCMKMTQ